MVVFSILIHAYSCTSPVPNSDLPAFKEKTVINGALRNTGIIEFTVSNNANAYSTINPSSVSNAQIIFKEDDITIPVTYDPVNTRYFANIIPKPASRYFISVQAGSNPLALSIAVMPSLLQNAVSKLQIGGGVDASGVTSDLISIAWTDNGAEKNYYKINFLYYSELAGQFLPFEYNVTDDVLLSTDAVKTNDGGYIFRDNSFNGKQKSLSAVPPFGLVSNTAPYKYLIQLQNISEDYYKYSTTLQRFRDAQDFNQGLFTEPIVVYSNIINGLGIWAGITMQSDTLK